MINNEDKKRSLNIDALETSAISHKINDTISEKGGQSMMKSLKALDSTSNDNANETPRSMTGRLVNPKRYSVGGTRDLRKIQDDNQQTKEDQNYILEEEPGEERLRRVIKKRFPIDTTKREFELGQLLLPMSVNKFFELFIADGAQFGHDIFCSEIL